MKVPSISQEFEGTCNLPWTIVSPENVRQMPTSSPCREAIVRTFPPPSVERQKPHFPFSRNPDFHNRKLAFAFLFVAYILSFAF
jgi:hypothetical protein